MKISWLKLPGLYDILFLLFLMISFLFIGIACLTPWLDFSQFKVIRTALLSHLAILTWIGLALHIISYWLSFHIPAMLTANLLGIGAFLIFWLLPSVLLVPVVLLLSAILLTLKVIQRTSA